MNILVFSEYYYPERFLIHEITEELVKKGHSVTVVTGKPNYNFPNGKVPVAYRKIKYEEINGVKVYRCNVLGRGKNKIRLLLNYLSFACNAKRLSKKIANTFDVVYCYQLTPVTQLYPAIHYAKHYGIPLVCYCLDLAPLSGEKILEKLHLFRILYQKSSQKLYNSCDKILVTSRSFIEYLVKVNHIEKRKIGYLPQHAADYYCVSSQDISANNDHVFTFLFAGNIGFGPRLENFVYSAKILIDKGITNFRVIFVGDGSHKHALIDIVKQNELNDYILFFDGVPSSEMQLIYQQADVLLVSLRKGQITVPGKLQAYMSTGKPILGMLDGSGKDLIAEVDCGKCVSAEDYRTFSILMEEAVLHPDSLAQKGLNGRKYYMEHFLIESHVNSLISEFNSL